MPAAREARSRANFAFPLSSEERPPMTMKAIARGCLHRPEATGSGGTTNGSDRAQGPLGANAVNYLLFAQRCLRHSHAVECTSRQTAKQLIFGGQACATRHLQTPNSSRSLMIPDAGRRMNVLFVIHYPVYGGPHNQALLLARELKRRGVSMTVVLPEGADSAAQRLRTSGIDVITIPLHRARATLRLGPLVGLGAHLPGEVNAIRRIIRERSIDIVQLGGLVNPHGAIAGRLEGAAVVWQLLDTRPPMAVRRLLMPLVLRLSDAIMTTGEAVARVHPGAEAFDERLLPFFPPVDSERFDPHSADRESARASFGFETDDLVIGTVGNLNPQKGHEFLLHAAGFARTVHPRLKVLIVGSSHETHRAYERKLQRLMDRLGLVTGRDVVFAGSLEDVRPALAAMDVFVLSSVPRSEGAPTAVEEAMMMTRPIVAADVGAVSELIEDGVTGFLAPPLDPRALSEEILRMADDPGSQARMGALGRERAIALCSVEECARIHLEAYDRALTHRRSAPARKRRLARAPGKP